MIDINYISKKHKLDSLEENILKFIIDNINDKKSISIRNVAQENFTSTSVIYKCMKKLGYSSYSDFIFFLKNKNSFMNISEEIIEEKDENFNEALEIFKTNRENLFMFLSTGIGNNISSYMHERMTIEGMRSLANGHLQLLESTLSKDIILIVISQSGETESILDMLKIAKKNKIRSISFIGKKNSTIEKLSTISLVTNGDMFFAHIIIIFEELLKRL
ncbi:MurR/RpiR family transcriptional regulator [Cetobacterium sp. SF1]|uniref:MurR/RpiR family transcriptional regulator n=1 Tax=Cetobacterium sp. SF1 TaxID=3417654 RepID=UPI003CE732B2